MSETATSTPVRKRIEVACPPARAFEVFTREIGTWWPTETHALNPGEVREVIWEEHIGGEVYEVAASGERSRWATVLVWEPPRRLVVAWQVNPERLGLEVEVTFTGFAEGTLVDLEHRGFESLADGLAARASYDPGWDLVLGRLVARLG